MRQERGALGRVKRRFAWVCKLRGIQRHHRRIAAQARATSQQQLVGLYAHACVLNVGNATLRQRLGGQLLRMARAIKSRWPSAAHQADAATRQRLLQSHGQ